MQIVISINDKLYDRIKYLEPRADTMLDELMRSVQNGTPLPKGQGRLITEPTEEEIRETLGGKNDFADCIRESVKAVFANAQTIIETDKADSEVKDGNDD